MIRYQLPLLVLLTSVLLHGCGEGGRDSPQDVVGLPTIVCPEDKYTDISSDLATGMTMTSGCYRINSAVNVKAGTLTIMPNTVVQFTAGASLTISDQGSLVANGNSAQPILFTGQVKQPGSWDGIVFHHTPSPLNSITYATIEYAGGNVLFAPGFAATVVFTGPSDTHPIDTNASGASNGRIVFSNNHVRNSGSYGVYIGKDSSLQDFANNHFSDNAKSPLMLYASNINLLQRSNSFALKTNKLSRIHIIGNEIGKIDAVTATPAIFPNFEQAEYFVSSHPLSQGSNGIVTNVPTQIEAGARFVFDEKTAFVVSSGLAYLRAIGQADKKIVFTGMTKTGQTTPGSWKGLVFYENANTNNELDHVIIEYGGDTYNSQTSQYSANLVVIPPKKLNSDTQIKLRNSTLRQSAKFGIGLKEPAKLVEFTNNIVTQNVEGPLVTGIRTLSTIDATNNLSANFANDFIYVDSTTIERTEFLTLPTSPGRLPYRFKGELSVYGSLTVQAGTTLQFPAQKGLQVFGDKSRIVIRGTPSERILLTGTAPQPGAWQGIVVNDSVNPENALEYVTVEYGGALVGQKNGNIAIVSSQTGQPTENSTTITISNVESRNSLSFGLWKDPSANILFPAGSPVFFNNAGGEKNF